MLNFFFESFEGKEKAKISVDESKRQRSVQKPRVCRQIQTRSFGHQLDSFRHRRRRDLLLPLLQEVPGILDAHSGENPGRKPDGESDSASIRTAEQRRRDKATQRYGQLGANEPSHTCAYSCHSQHSLQNLLQAVCSP